MNTMLAELNLDAVTDWLNSLWGAPGVLLVVVLCIAFCYVCRFLPSIPNRAIPLICIITGAALMPVFAPACPVATSLIAWRIRALVIGIVVGIVAWAVHRVLLSKIEDKIPGLANLLNAGDSAKTPTDPPALTSSTPVIMDKRD